MNKIFLLSSLLMIVVSLKAQQTDTIMIDDRVFNRVEVDAQFPGGFAGWKNFVVKTLNPNTPVDHGAPMGTYLVIVRFIVSKTGEISEVVAETKNGYGMEQEAIRVIKNGPNWIPAMQNQRPVNAYRRQPINFVVMDENIDIDAPKKFSVGKNKIAVKVNKFENEDIELTVDNGTIVNEGNGNYTLVPSTKGKLIISISGTKKGKKILLGAAYYPVEE